MNIDILRSRTRTAISKLAPLYAKAFCRQPSITPTSPLQRRLFSANYFNPVSAFTSQTTAQTLTAHSVFPYPAQPIFDIITDIPSYPKFIPYLTTSIVSQHSEPDARMNRKWPQLATLTIGYSSGPVEINESFISRVFCVPPVSNTGKTADQRSDSYVTNAEAYSGVGFVEALSGTAIKSGLEEHLIAHHLHASSSSQPSTSTTSSETPSPPPAEDASASSSSPLDYLRTRWTIRPIRTDSSDPETEVMLSIEYRFRNIMFEMLGSTVAPRLADGVLRVFEGRARKLLEKDGS